MIVYVFNQRELRSPIAIAALLIAFVIWRSEWLGLVGLPMIWLAWTRSSPSVNLIDGLLPTLPSIIAVSVGYAISDIGLRVAAGVCMAAWLIASWEASCEVRRWTYRTN